MNNISQRRVGDILSGSRTPAGTSHPNIERKVSLLGMLVSSNLQEHLISFSISIIPLVIP